MNWSAVGAIGTCISGIATFCAVYVALFQQRKSAKLFVVREPYETGDVKKYTEKAHDSFCFHIYNNGSKNIYISEWGIEQKKEIAMRLADCFRYPDLFVSEITFPCVFVK